MGKLTLEEMDAIATTKQEQTLALKKLMKNDFDPKNIRHIKALKKYVGEFEYSTHQMYIFQGLRETLMFWKHSLRSSALIGGSIWFLLCLPFVSNLVWGALAVYLAIGGSGYALEQFKTTDYFNQFQEMRQIYNWCLKEGKENYNNTDNTEKFKIEEVQRMIKIMAPLCPIQFIKVWPDNFRDESLTKQVATELLNLGKNIVTNISYTLFGSSSETKEVQPPTEAQKKAWAEFLDVLKQIEENKVSLDPFSAMKQAFDYFRGDINFHNKLKGYEPLIGAAIKENVAKPVTEEAISLFTSKRS